MTDGSKGAERQSGLRLALEKLAQGRGVQRSDLLEALDGELIVLRKRLGLNASTVDVEDDQKLRAWMRAAIIDFLTIQIETLTPPRGKSKRTYAHAVLVSFNALLDKSHADLEDRDITERRAWLASEEVPEAYRISIRTSQRYLDRAIAQMEQRLLDPDYKPEIVDEDDYPFSLSASVASVELDPPVLQRSSPTHAEATSAPKAVQKLTSVLQSRYNTERRIRRVHDPFPLPVRWSRGPAHLADHWANVVGSPDGETHLCVPQTGTVADVLLLFDAIPSRRLVILGRPGAGKTTLTLEFVWQFLEAKRHQLDSRVPVILPVATWDPSEQSLRDWMAAQLSEFPGLRKRKRKGKQTVAAELVYDGHIFPILDGLDEMEAELRPYALKALNAQLDRGDPFILTSRAEEYAAAVEHGDVLTAAAVIHLEDVTFDDIADYLPRTTRPTNQEAARTKWDPVLDRLRNAPTDPAASALLSVLTTPLMVSLARTIYSDGSDDPIELLDTEEFADAWEIADHLLDSFVPAVYDRPPQDADATARSSRWDAAKTERWLGCLALRLHAEGEQTLQLWAARSSYVYVFAGLLFTTSILLGISTLFLGREVGYLDAIAGGLFLGFSGGMVADWRYPEGEDVGAMSGVVGRMLVGVALYGSAWRLDSVWEWIVLYVVSTFVGSWTVYPRWLGFGINTSKLVRPGEVVQAFRKNVMLKVALAGLGIAGLPVLVCRIIFGTPRTATAALLVLIASCALGNALASGWFSGLLTRAYLALTGQAPLRLLAFLDDAHGRGILRQTGILYEFRHALLHDRLADCALEEMQPGKFSRKKVAIARANLAVHWMNAGRRDIAETEFRSVLEGLRGYNTAMLTLKVRDLLSELEWLREGYDESIDHLHEILADKRELLGNTHRLTLDSWGILIKALVAVGRTGEAEKELASLLEHAKGARTVEDNPHVSEARQRLADPADKADTI
jgi:hypothetical protein